MTFGKRLKELREKMGYTQRQLADLLKISNSSLAMYELDKREPDNATLARLADFFNVSVDYLLGRTDDPGLPVNAIAFGDFFPVPIVGRIRAGNPALAVENIEGYEPLPVKWLNGVPENHFLLRVVGDSMEQARIYDGDLALIKKQPSPNHNGQICAVGILDDAEEPYATLKRVYELDEQYIELVPANDKYPRRKVHKKDVIIYGILKKTIREHD